VTEKRFPPSAQKLAKARREGRIVNSRWFAVAIGIFVTGLVGQRTISLVRDRTLIHYREGADSPPLELLMAGFRVAIESTACVLLTVAAVGVSAHMLQTRGAFSLSRFATAACQIGPRAFPGRVRECARDVPAAIMRAGVVLGVTLPALFGFVGMAGELAGVNWGYALIAVDGMLETVLSRVCMALAVVAVGSYYLVHRRFFKDLSMNIEELRQEMREDCGDQHLKSMRKADAQALSLADLEQRVKRSKVVVVQRKRL
jgi:flagellar biosynthesis protein FlhB